MSRNIVSTLLLASLAATAIHCAVIPVGVEISGINGGNGLIYIGSTVTHGKAKDGSAISQRSTYFKSQNSAFWHDALNDCKAFLGLTATLLYIETLEELGNVTTFLNKGEHAALYWIGGQYNINSGKFEWANEVGFRPWAPWSPGHPDTQLPVTKVQLYTVGGVQFRAQFQTTASRYLCEVKTGVEEEQLDPCYNDNDLIMVVDSSGSIGQANYINALEFTIRLATTWADNPGNRLSVVIFSSTVVTSIRLTDKMSVSEIREKIYSIQYLGSNTQSHLGLDNAFTELQLNIRAAPQNIVFLTDGMSTSPQLTLDAALRIQNAGISSFSFGITNNVNQAELLAIAGNKKEHVFNTADFQKLLKLLQSVSRRVCP